MKSLNIKRILGLFLAVIMLVMSITVTAFAAEEENSETDEVVHAEYNPDDWMMAGTAVLNTIGENNWFQLTPNNEWQSGAIWYNYSYTEDFTIELEYYIGDGGTGSGQGADGMTIAFYTDFGFTLAQGGSLGYSGFGGYAIELDTHYNSENADPNYNHIALLQDSVGTHLTTSSLNECEDQKWHKLKMVVEGEMLKVYIDGSEEPRISYTLEGGFSGKDGGWLGITAATGSLKNTHAVRNIEITGKRSASEKFFDVSLSHELIGYENGVYEYEITAAITNNAPKTAPDVVTTITLDDSLRLESGASDKVSVGDVNGKATKEVKWTVYADCPIDGNDYEASYSTDTTISSIKTEFKNENTISIKHKNTVSFDANGGQGIMDDLFVLDGETDLPSCDFTAPEGYMFAGWSTSADGEVVSSEDYYIEEKITFYAIWRESAIISFDSNGGKGSMQPVELFKGSVDLPSCEIGAPNGKMFKGWALTADGSVIPNNDFDLTENITLYAVWETYYTVSIGTEGGTDYIYDKVFGGEMILPECTLTYPDGYTFGGWSKTEGGEAITSDRITVSENITLYPVWLKLYNVSFNANGGSGEMESKPFAEGKHDLPVCEFVAPEGMMFVGWATSYDGEIIKELVLTGDVTLYAKWENYYTVTFDSNGGSGEMSAVTVIGNDKMGNPSCEFTPPEKHRFKGWATSYDGEIIDSFDFTENVTLYAVWERYYAISFNANGGSGEMKEIIGLPDGKILMPACTFTAPEKHRIKGWSLTPDGEVLSGEFLDVSDDITLYAIWEKIPDFEAFPEVEEFVESIIKVDVTKENLIFAVVVIVAVLGVIGLGVAVFRKYF